MVGVFKPIEVVQTLKQKLDIHFHFWRYLFLLVFFLTLPFLSGILPIVRFTDEQIDIQVFPEHVVMQGTYVYQNPYPFPVVQGLSVPFPIDSDHPTPILMTARQLGTKPRLLETRYLLGRHRFNVIFKANEQVQIAVEYRQQASQQNATYLLTTTKPWKRPLQKGLYRLWPQQVVITGSNYDLESAGHNHLSFEREHFMPQEDWSFSWKVN